jgi:hypothetical protein
LETWLSAASQSVLQITSAPFRRYHERNEPSVKR